MLKSVVKLSAMKELLKSNPKVIVDFYADWCGPCQRIGPLVSSIATKTPGITFLKVNVDDAEELVNEYKVASMPTFVAFNKEQEVKRFSGADEKKLADLIEQLTKL